MNTTSNSLLMLTPLDTVTAETFTSNNLDNRQLLNHRNLHLLMKHNIVICWYVNSVDCLHVKTKEEISGCDGIVHGEIFDEGHYCPNIYDHQVRIFLQPAYRCRKLNGIKCCKKSPCLLTSCLGICSYLQSSIPACRHHGPYNRKCAWSPFNLLHWLSPSRQASWSM